MKAGTADSAGAAVRARACATIVLLLVTACLLLIPGGARAERLVLPRSLTEISDEAFRGNESVKTVILQENVRVIGARAFADSALTSIVLPESVEVIAEDAFSGCAFTAHVKEGSAAHAYCVRKGIPWEPLAEGAAHGYPETNHPYTADDAEYYEYGAPAYVDYLLVTFSADTALSSNEYDSDSMYIGGGHYHDSTIYYGSNVATLLAGKTIRIEGHTLKIWFTERSIANGAYGFRVTDIRHGFYTPLRSAACSDAVLASWGGYLSWNAEAEGGFLPLRYTWTVERDGAVIGVYNTDESELLYTPGATGGYRARVRVTDARGHTADASSGLYQVTTASIDDASLYTYEALDGGGIRITGYLGSGIRYLSVPSHIDGLPVKEIGVRAFSRLEGLCWELLLPEGVERIGEYAFEYNSLDSINLPQTLREIGAYAFLNSHDLTSITLPPGVTTIADSTFYFCYDLKSVRLTAVETIGDSAFGRCEKLAEVIWPDALKTIGDSAFGYCKALEAVHLPDSVTSIGYQAFYRCTALKTVDMPDTVTAMGRSAFSGCAALTTADLSNGLASISNGAFWDCSALEAVALPNRLEMIEQSAFSGCVALKAMDLPDSVQEIGQNAFKDCAFERLTYPASLEKLPEVFISGLNKQPVSPFIGCSADVVLFSGNVRSIAPCAFRDWLGLERITIPDTVETLGERAFMGCANLTEIVLPAGLKSVASNLFAGCTALQNVNIPDGVTAINPFAFLNCAAIETLRLPNHLTFISDDAFINAHIGTLYYPTGFTAFGIKTTYDNDPDGYYHSGWNETVRETSPFEGASVVIDSLIIPEGTTVLPKYAFAHVNVYSVSLPSTLKTIPSHAFYGTPLRSVTFSEGLINIERSAFQYENLGDVQAGGRLTTLLLPESVERIMQLAFWNQRLAWAYLGRNVTYIGPNAFNTSVKLYSGAPRGKLEGLLPGSAISYQTCDVLRGGVHTFVKWDDMGLYLPEHADHVTHYDCAECSASRMEREAGHADCWRCAALDALGAQGDMPEGVYDLENRLLIGGRIYYQAVLHEEHKGLLPVHRGASSSGTRFVLDDALRLVTDRAIVQKACTAYVASSIDADDVTSVASLVQQRLETAQLINDVNKRNEIIGTIGSAAIAALLLDPSQAVSVISGYVGDALKVDNFVMYMHFMMMESAADAAWAQAQKAVELEARFSDTETEFNYDRTSDMIAYYANVVALKELVDSYSEPIVAEVLKHCGSVGELTLHYLLDMLSPLTSIIKTQLNDTAVVMLAGNLASNAANAAEFTREMLEISAFFSEVKSGVKDVAFLAGEIEHFEDFAELGTRIEEIKTEFTATSGHVNAWVQIQQKLAP